MLRAGHTVHATVRDPARNTEQLKALPGAVDRLKLFKADLTLPGRSGSMAGRISMATRKTFGSQHYEPPKSASLLIPALHSRGDNGCSGHAPHFGAMVC